MTLGDSNSLMKVNMGLQSTTTVNTGNIMEFLKKEENLHEPKLTNSSSGFMIYETYTFTSIILSHPQNYIWHSYFSFFQKCFW